MRITGIDEAGYGPILGPLVVSSVSFDVPDRASEKCLWTLLEGAVTRRVRPGRRDARLSVCDSKKLYSGNGRLNRLERTALAFLGTVASTDGDSDQILGSLDPEWNARRHGVHWYEGEPLRVPLAADGLEVRTQRAALLSSLSASGVRLVNIRSVILPARQFNHMVAATRNKSAVALWATMRLVSQALSECETAHSVTIDRQGGRTSYAGLLMKHLDIDTLHIADQSAQCSRYTLTHLPGLCDVSFLTRGESSEFAIALASIISKYIRELCMHRFNQFWRARIEGLAATAGYYSDGIRFLEAVRPHLGRLGIDEKSFVRIR